MTPRMLDHNRVKIALHTLVEGEGTPLLVLHGLGEKTSPARDPWSRWPGPVYGIDFTGHGASTVPSGGGYTAEVLMSDVDVALAEIGIHSLSTSSPTTSGQPTTSTGSCICSCRTRRWSNRSSSRPGIAHRGLPQSQQNPVLWSPRPTPRSTRSPSLEP